MLVSTSSLLSERDHSPELDRSVAPDGGEWTIPKCNIYYSKLNFVFLTFM